jgi:acyl-CoA synthetase (AMP-forming)/AMP-acid ligase II/aminoglycoside N3'-acetyltransferase/acyl carrier protein
MSRSLNNLLAERAAGDGASPFAFFSNDTPVTADQLFRIAERAAEGLVAAGMKRGSRVLILAPTTPLLLACIFANWRIGAMVCVADAFLQPQGLAQVTAQYRPDLALFDPAVEGSGLKRALAAEAPLLRFDQFERWPRMRIADETIDPEQAAICIFTSGSTGTPRGIVHSHRSLIAGAQNVISAKNIRANDRVLCVLPLSHINGMVTTLITPLLSGSSVVYLQGPFIPLTALKLIDEHSCTWFSAVPTQYAYLVRPRIDPKHWSLRSLRFCRSASAPLPISIKKEFEAHYEVPIVETMGMTETAGQIFCNPIPPNTGPAGSVGRPIGWDVRVVDRSGVELPDETVGEIQVRGSAMMRGYLDAPEETRTTLIDGWLSSGDLGRRDANGFYFLTGRLKDIAIFSGTNISLRAIEAAAQENPLVGGIACVGEHDDFFGERVVAYVVPRSIGDEPARVAAAVTTVLNGSLPSPQALKEVRIVAELPRSGIGKVLKGKLSGLSVLYSTHRQLSHDPKQLLAEILHISADQIHEALRLGSIRQWDSLGHVSLVLAVESLLGRLLADHEIIALTTFRGLRSLLAGSLEETDVRAASATQLDDVPENREQRDLIEMMRWNRLLPDIGELQPAGTDTRGSQDPSNKVLTFDELMEALRKAGLGAGDTLLLHADITALGRTEAGHDREAVLEFYFSALRAGLGETGTLAMCTSFEDYGRYETPFVLEDSPSRLGSLSEYVRTRPDAVRSLHPIVSVTAIGPAAQKICAGPHLDGFGYDSPWGRLHRANAKLMTLGMGRYPGMGLTFLHYIENAFGVPYQYTKIYNAPVIARGQTVAGPFTMSVRYLDFGSTYDTNRFKNELVSAGLARLISVGKDWIFCTTSNDAMTYAIQQLRRDRYYFLKNPPNFRPGEIPMDGATGKMQYVYDRPTDEQR